MWFQASMRTSRGTIPAAVIVIVATADSEDGEEGEPHETAVSKDTTIAHQGREAIGITDSVMPAAGCETATRGCHGEPVDSVYQSSPQADVCRERS